MNHLPIYCIIVSPVAAWIIDLLQHWKHFTIENFPPLVNAVHILVHLGFTYDNVITILKCVRDLLFLLVWDLAHIVRIFVVQSSKPRQVKKRFG